MAGDLAKDVFCFGLVNLNEPLRGQGDHDSLPRYFYKLRKAKMALPRRQEAERDTCRLPDGSERPALVTGQEIREWVGGERHAIICSVSHSWETREHPDPCRFQLEQIVNYVSLFDAAYFDDTWLFYDYVSLFQFMRHSEQEEESFRRSVQNMHVLYAHEFTRTLRIESLTPGPVWEAMLSSEADRVRAYHFDTGEVTERPLKDLIANRAPYGDRGWCKAEVEWSIARSSTASHRRIDAAMEGGEDSDLDGSSQNRGVPTVPEEFHRQMAQAAFTHRPDAHAVVRLHEKTFHERVSVCEEAVFQHLAKADFAALARALPHYQRLRRLQLCDFNCSQEDAQAICQAGPDPPRFSSGATS